MIEDIDNLPNLFSYVYFVTLSRVLYYRFMYTYFKINLDYTIIYPFFEFLFNKLRKFLVYRWTPKKTSTNHLYEMDYYGIWFLQEVSMRIRELIMIYHYVCTF